MSSNINPGPIDSLPLVKRHILSEISRAIDNRSKQLISLDNHYSAYQISYNKRFVIVDKNGSIISSANGYGFKTIETAKKALSMMLGGPLEKPNIKKSLQREIEKENPEKFIKASPHYKAYYVESINRYVIIDDVRTISANGNGYGYRSIKTAKASANYLEEKQKRQSKHHKRSQSKHHKRSNRLDSYDIDMELADCYYGYNEADFY